MLTKKCTYIDSFGILSYLFKLHLQRKSPNCEGMGRISMSLSHPLSCWFQWSVFCYILFRSVINNVQCDVNTSEESHWSHSQPSSEAWIKLDCWSLLPSFGRWRQNPPCCVTTSKSWRLVERIITKTLITALLLLYLTCMEHVQKLNTLISDIKFKITVRCLTMFINIDANPEGAD